MVSPVALCGTVLGTPQQCSLPSLRLHGPRNRRRPHASGVTGRAQNSLPGSLLADNAHLPTSTDEILKRGHCTGDNGVYVCPNDMMGLCNLYLKNEVILSCKLGK